MFVFILWRSEVGSHTACKIVVATFVCIAQPYKVRRAFSFYIFTLALALGTVHLLFTLSETIQPNANILFFFTSGARWWEECPEAR